MIIKNFISVLNLTHYIAPSGSPETIEILGTTRSSIRVFWSEVKENERNGIIIKYALCYTKFQSVHACLNFHEMSAIYRNYVLSDLKPYTVYMIFIKAATIAGWGPTASHSHRTLSARKYQYVVVDSVVVVVVVFVNGGGVVIIIS